MNVRFCEGRNLVSPEALSPRSAADPLRVVIVEDEPLFRELLQVALGQSDEFHVVATYAHGEEAVPAIAELQPDVVILDIELGQRMNGISLGIELRRSLPDLGIVLLSNHRVRTLLELIPRGREAGWCYLLKDTVQDMDMLRRTLRGAAAGMFILDPEIVVNSEAKPESDLAGLTPRQLQTLQLMAKGYTNEGIAQLLSVSVKSVENHIIQVYRQLDLDRGDRTIQPRVQAVIKYIEQTRGVEGPDR